MAVQLGPPVVEVAAGAVEGAVGGKKIDALRIPRVIRASGSSMQTYIKHMLGGGMRAEGMKV